MGQDVVPYRAEQLQTLITDFQMHVTAIDHMSLLSLYLFITLPPAHLETNDTVRHDTTMYYLTSINIAGCLILQI